MHVLFLSGTRNNSAEPIIFRSKKIATMTQQQRYAQLENIIKVYLPEDVPSHEITLESHFLNELNINSAHLVDIVLDVEDAFDIRLENEDMDQMQTVKDALAIIERKLAV